MTQMQGGRSPWTKAAGIVCTVIMLAGVGVHALPPAIMSHDGSDEGMADTCADVSGFAYESGCATISIDKREVKTGEEVTVNVNISCNSSGLEVALSRALMDRVFLDGALVPQAQLRSGGPSNLYQAFYLFNKPQPIGDPGPVVKLPSIGSHTIKFTIDPRAPSTCHTITGTPGRSNYQARGPWASLGAQVAGSFNPFSVHVPFTINRVAVPLIVTSTGDARDLKPGDESCDTGDVTSDGKPECTLRAAIQEADSTDGRDTIRFNIPGSGLPVIRPGFALPEITKPVSIDGTSQPGGYVVLDGLDSRRSLEPANGLTLKGGNSEVTGLVIQSFTGYGLALVGGGGNRVENVKIGTDPEGLRAAGNGVRTAGPQPGGGLLIDNSPSNTILRNLISGNDGDGILIQGAAATSNVVQGNHIGTNASGILGLGNTGDGVIIKGAPGNTIGGTSSQTRNIISGNGGAPSPTGGNAGIGVLISEKGATGNHIQGNIIGLNVSGDLAVPNSEHGVRITDASSNTIGGSAAGAGNVISGNDRYGIHLAGDSNTVQGNLIGTRTNGVDRPGRSSGSEEPQRFGIQIQDGSRNTIGGSGAGAANTIAFNKVGIALAATASDSVRNQLSRNRMFSNGEPSSGGALGIDLDWKGADGLITPNDYGLLGIDSDSGTNNLQNFPDLTDATIEGGSVRLQGILSSVRNTGYTLEFYGETSCSPQGPGQGKTFLAFDSVTTDSDGRGAFRVILPLTLTPGSFITATATDPDKNTSEFSTCVRVQGSTQTDVDGVSDEVEARAPNNGDGNGDGVADSQQRHVVSLPLLSGRYITLASPAGTVFKNVEAVPLPIGALPPPGQIFADGLARFVVASDPLSPRGAAAITPGGAVTVTMIVPPVPSGSHWNFGPEPGRTTPHWYAFNASGAPGAQITGNRVTLQLIDGQRGDHDLLANAEIVTVGGLASPTVTVTPASGLVTGGTKVTIKGQHFASGVTVKFDTGAATTLTVVDPQTILATTPTHAPGAATLVITQDGLETAVANAFTYLTAPASETTDADADGMPDTWELQYGLDPRSASDASADPDADGHTNRQEFQAGSHPHGLFAAYLAEGATGAFFDEAVALLNPSSAPILVLARFLKSDGNTISRVLTLNGLTRATLDPEALSGLETAEFSIVIEADGPVVADRTMRWNATGYGSHAERGIPSPALMWFLAEGATHSGFDLFYLIQNPTASAATVHVKYLLPAPAAPLLKSYTIAPNSRFNIWVDQQDPKLASTDVAAVLFSLNHVPIIVERAMYLNTGGLVFGAGHNSAGVTATATQWFLAEGATGPYFDEFVLIANPGTTAAAVEARYLLPDGTVLVKTYTVAANSRFNIWIDLEDPKLQNTAVSTTITSTNAVPIIVERSMWWPGTPPTWQEAHNSPGATETGTRWALAEGEVGGASSTETYILIANTSGTAGAAKVTLAFEDGSTAEQTFALNPNSRFNVAVASAFPGAIGQRFGAIVESLGSTPAQIVVERAMYSNAGGIVWAAGTNALATRLR